MLPRQRIFRSAYGRAASTMHLYDQGLEEHGRLNHAGPAAALQVLKDSRQRQYELCDFLWNQGHLDVLFVELWRLHEAQINRLSKAQLRKEWSIPASEVNAFLQPMVWRWMVGACSKFCSRLIGRRRLAFQRTYTKIGARFKIN